MKSAFHPFKTVVGKILCSKISSSKATYVTSTYLEELKINKSTNLHLDRGPNISLPR